MTQGAIGHPLTLSLMTALLATIASQHYLHRMERWLTSHKPKRKLKNEDVPARLLDEDVVVDEGFQSHQTTYKSEQNSECL